MVSELISQRAYATEAGTRRFLQRHGRDKAPDAYAHLGHLTLSSVGIGTYLGTPCEQTDQAYAAAVIDAVRRGINVVDTASNYRCQRSEIAVGQALKTLIDGGEIYRSEVLVASAAGLVAFDGAPAPDAAQWFREATVGRGLCDEAELVAGCHCMAPAYLRETLLKSLENLALETLDVYFVHNPETQLHLTDRTLFDERLRRAFEALEEAADQGLTRVYGIASWAGVRARQTERDWLSLERVIAIAEQVAGSRHRCRALQLPLNLAMPEAMLRANQPVRGQLLTPLQAAERLGMVVFSSSPLHQGRLGKSSLGHVPALPPECVPEVGERAAIQALQFARSVPGVACTLVGMRQLDHVAMGAQLLHHQRAPAGWVHAAAQPNPSGSYAI